ncbi:MAG: phage major capsid protein [Sphingomonadales bacterium]|jgi:HK97 family phage major capsid protein
MTEQNAASASYEIKAAVDGLGYGHDEFKMDEPMNAGIATGGSGNNLQEKLERLNTEVSQLEERMQMISRAAARPRLSGDAAAEMDTEENEQKSLFLDNYVRRGSEAEIARFESKSLNIGNPADGGYAVPEVIDESIDRLLTDISPVRSVANVVQVGSSNYKKLISTTGPASGWVGETAARPETDTPNFAEITPPLGEIYANPAATQAMLDDAFFDVEAWLSEELATEFGAMEGAAFINGDGVNKPKGILSYATDVAEDSARAFGTLQHISTGVSGAFPATDPSDILVDLVHELRPAYRQGAVFLMNTNTLAQIRKFKDADGNYLWRPGLGEGSPATLLGYPVMEAEDMPDIGADSLSIAFGNFNRGYLIADRMGTRILRDPYSNKPFVHFYATRRTGGAVVNSEAIKLLKFSIA